MTFSGLIDRLDDWLNPIVVKELRQAVKSRVVTSILLIFLGIQVLIISIFLAFREVNSGGDPMSWRGGSELFMTLQAILLGTCMVVIPAHAALRMNGERSDSNVDLLFISTLRPTGIIAGKFFSALVLTMLVFACCAPFMTFTYLLRGIDIPSILFIIGVDLLAVLGATQLGLFLAAIPAARALKFCLFVLAAIMLVWTYAGVVAGTSELVRFGVPGDITNEFWVVMGMIALSVLFGTGMLFFWSVALISPPSANRAMPGRVFLVLMWLLLGAACLGLTCYNWGSGGSHGPLAVWMGWSVFLFCLQFLISINERDSWGPRVARTIPRSRILRSLAFLFYSGSAGGIIISVICIALSLFLPWLWQVTYPTFSFASESDNVRIVMAAVALYTYCYGMSAVLIRYYFLRNWLRPVVTWVLALVLLGLGSALPWITALAVYTDSFGRYNDMKWWQLTVPFGSIPEIAMDMRGSGSDFTSVCLSFLAGWAAIVTILSLGWVGGQIQGFHPPAPRVKERPAPAAEPVPATEPPPVPAAALPGEG
jgi:hypothetical protein